MPMLKNLETLDIFQDLTDDELAEIQKLCREEEYQRNDKLFTEGDPADDLWIIIKARLIYALKCPTPNRLPRNQQCHPTTMLFLKPRYLDGPVLFRPIR